MAEGIVSRELETGDFSCLVVACNLIVGLVKNLSILGTSLHHLGC